MKRLYALLALSLATGMLTGCEEFLGKQLNIHLSTSSPVLKSDEPIIAARLREHTETLSPHFLFAPAENGIVVTAKGSPPESDIRFLLQQRGVFEVKGANGAVWFGGQDIVDVRVGIDQQAPLLILKLTPDGTARLARLSAAAVGTRVSVELDGQQLAAAHVSTPIEDGMLQITSGRSIAETKLIATLLRTGVLSFTTREVRIELHQ